MTNASIYLRVFFVISVSIHLPVLFVISVSIHHSFSLPFVTPASFCHSRFLLLFPRRRKSSTQISRHFIIFLRKKRKNKREWQKEAGMTKGSGSDKRKREWVMNGNANHEEDRKMNGNANHEENTKINGSISHEGSGNNKRRWCSRLVATYSTEFVLINKYTVCCVCQFHALAEKYCVCTPIVCVILFNAKWF